MCCNNFGPFLSVLSKNGPYSRITLRSRLSKFGFMSGKKKTCGERNNNILVTKSWPFSSFSCRKIMIWWGVGILRYSGFSEILASDITPRYFAYSSSKCAAIIIRYSSNGVNIWTEWSSFGCVCSGSLALVWS